MSLSQENLYLTVSTPLGEDILQVRHVSGEESLSGLFSFTLEMISEDDSLDFSRIVGQNATVTIQLPNDTQRYVNGIVTRFVQAGSDTLATIYYADLRPWFWLLTLTADSRIFQNQTVPEIIEAVFATFGFTDYRNALTATYTAREYCVQYQESAFAFVSRLMEDEGIFYFFEHTADKHTLVLADDADAHAACPGLTAARVQQSASTGVAEDIVTACFLEQQVTPDAYALGDFHFVTPSTSLHVSVNGSSGKQRIYEYPGGYTQTDAGEKKANLRLSAHELPARLLKGQSHCRAFIAGYTFSLTEHSRTDLNSTYVLQWVSLTATQERYANSFAAFPASTVFRSRCVTPKPRLTGTQTAIVVGKSGEEIWTDQYGRIKVQFHWDQEGKNDENSSCWVRVAQTWAGQGWGSLFLPRIGQEVVVSFVNGDPDCPLVIGAVYNAQQTVPYSLPSEQTKSTIKSNSSKGGGGFNELRFEDKKDAEEIYLHAQKDLNLTVQHDCTTEVLNDATTTIKQNRSVTIQEANDTLVVEKGNRTLQVKTGDETHQVQGTRSVTVSGNETHTNEADLTYEITGDCTWTISGNLTLDVQGNVTIKAGGSLTNKASGSLSNEAGGSLSNEAGTSLTNKAGTSLTNKAGTSLTNDAALSLTNKAGATLSSSGAASHLIGSAAMVVIGAGLVKIDPSDPT
jgi:type VI secretion system secreted protein VgrG